MSAQSGIEWTDATWNPVTGCTKVSEGCRHCYAEMWAKRHFGEFSKDHARKFGDVRVHEDKLEIPLRWKSPKRIFVNSMSDLFHEDVPNDFIYRVWEVMERCPQHTFQILTKRPQRMVDVIGGTSGAGLSAPPLPNVWLGVSVEDQKAADKRIPLLLMVPAAVRFLSCEPLLGPVDLSEWLGWTGKNSGLPIPLSSALESLPDIPGAIDWVICGGESGPHARPMHPNWARSLRDQCAAAGVPFFFKQWGEWAPWGIGCCDYLANFNCDEADAKFTAAVTAPYVNYRVGKKIAGRLLDGVEHSAFPDSK